MAGHLRQLDDLRREGVIDEDEFAAAKGAVLQTPERSMNTTRVDYPQAATAFFAIAALGVVGSVMFSAFSFDGFFHVSRENFSRYDISKWLSALLFAAAAFGLARRKADWRIATLAVPYALVIASLSVRIFALGWSDNGAGVWAEGLAGLAALIASGLVVAHLARGTNRWISSAAIAVLALIAAGFSVAIVFVDRYKALEAGDVTKFGRFYEAHLSGAQSAAIALLVLVLVLIPVAAWWLQAGRRGAFIAAGGALSVLLLEGPALVAVVTGDHDATMTAGFAVWVGAFVALTALFAVCTSEARSRVPA